MSSTPLEWFETSHTWADGSWIKQDEYGQIQRNDLSHSLAATGPKAPRFAYGNTDLPTTLTDAGGAAHQWEWNALGQMIAQIDCSQHDEMGRGIATQLPGELYWHHHYDSQGHLVELEGPQGFRQQFTDYDDVGRLSELTLGHGAVYRFAYDEMDETAGAAVPLR